mmetsp:Transcript_14267/g.16862  ORF Transcript_14267/g.16862 Transcript_14267/m.16862 type:complete len:315 (+) Transcript_14267:75-1019(+)
MGDPQADISNKIKEVGHDSNDTKFTTHPSSLPSSSSQPPPPPPSSSPFSLGEFVFGGKGYFGKFSANQRNYRLQQCMELQLALEDCETRLRRRKARAAQRAAKVDQPPPSSSSEASWNRWFSSGSSGSDRTSTTTVGTDENDIVRKKKKKKKKKNQEKASSSSSNPPRIEDSKSGKKISLFYDWGLTGRAAAGPPATATAAATVGVGTVVAEPMENTIGKTSTTNRGRSNKKSCSMEHHAVWACRAMALGCAPDLMKLRKCFKNDLGTTNPEGIYYENGGDVDGTEGGRCQLEQRIVAQCVLRQEKELKDRLDG